MKLGVMIESQEGVGWNEWKNIVQWTEELGFESLWRSDHFFSFFSENKTIDSLDTLVAHTYTAMASSRLRFGPLVLSMSFRHPAVVARMAAAIDQLSGGRFILGLGAGWNVPEHEAFGIELKPVKDRLDNLEESVQVIKALFENERANFQGQHYQLTNAFMDPKPRQSPMPLLIGGQGEKRTLRMAAKYATEWNFIPVGGIEGYRHKAAVLKEHCEREGRDPATIDRSVMCDYVTGETDAEVARNFQARLDGLPVNWRHARMGKGSENLPLLVGKPAELIEQIQALEAEGVSRVMLQHLSPPSRERLAFIASEVLPKV